MREGEKVKISSSDMSVTAPATLSLKFYFWRNYSVGHMLSWKPDKKKPLGAPARTFEMLQHQPSYNRKNSTWSNHFVPCTHLKHLHRGTLFFIHTLAELPWKQEVFCSSILTKCCSRTDQPASALLRCSIVKTSCSSCFFPKS